ncbi:MAG TPA: chemotaxis protein CheD [Epulopiscium sp.]|nr:chemotaxis protein CheD [Candidatus Epulonipiscium sp.]
MSEGKTIKVGMADLNIAKSPDKLMTLGLGSCIGIVLYDPAVKVGGMAHIMLPDSTQIKNNSNLAKFADTAIGVLINKMTDIGANKSRLVAKLAGGAQMFDFKQTSDIMRVGYRNDIATRKILEELRIPIIADDTGENFGRTIELHTQTGALLIKTINHGTKEI